MSYIVVDASNILEVNEMTVFKHAHYFYYGENDTRKIEYDYSYYFRTDTVPFYVRFYCRRVIKKFTEREQQTTIEVFRKMLKRRSN